MIRSTIPTFYTLRSREQAIIEIAITNWRYEPMNERYVATVEDYAVITDEVFVEGEGEEPGSMQTAERKQQFNTKEVYYSKDQIDGLFQMIGSPILATDVFSNELVKLIAQALLYITKTDLYETGLTIHGFQPDQWVVNENYNKKI